MNTGYWANIVEKLSQAKFFAWEGPLGSWLQQGRRTLPGRIICNHWGAWSLKQGMPWQMKWGALYETDQRGGIYLFTCKPFFLSLHLLAVLLATAVTIILAANPLHFLRPRVTCLTDLLGCPHKRDLETHKPNLRVSNHHDSSTG